MKPIRFNTHLKVADKVRRAINRLNTSTVLMNQSFFECFDNCREQGYVLTICPKGTLDLFHIAFSESRNSDSIVVYVYTKTAYPSNLPDDNGWNDRHYFNWNEVEKAAKFILTKATTFVEQKA